MLIVLTGGSEDSLPAFAEQLGRRADFEIVLPYSDEIASYKPNSGHHYLTLHHHWQALIDEDSYVLNADFKMEELFLASRGGLSVVLPSSNPLLDMIHRQALTSITEMTPDNIVSVGRSLEHEVEPLNRWRHYIGYRIPTTLVICQPDRELRKSILADIPDDEWTTYGFVSSGATPEELDLLWLTLDTPELVGMGRLAPHIENWCETRGAVFR